MKGLSIISLLITLLIVAYLTLNSSKEATQVSNPKDAQNKVEEAEQKLNDAMQKTMDKLNQQQP